MKYVSIRFMFLLAFAFVLAGNGCISSEKQASKRVAKIIERYPSIIDTLIIDSSITTYIKTDTVMHVDTQFLDRIIHNVCDTIERVKRIESIQYLYKNCGDRNIIKTVYKDKIIQKRIAITCPEYKSDTAWQATKKYWGFGVLLFLLGGLFGFILRR